MSDRIHAPDPREERLPAWTRDSLQRLRSRVSELEDRNAVLRGSAKPSSFSLSEWDSGERGTFYLPDNEIVFEPPGALGHLAISHVQHNEGVGWLNIRAETRRGVLAVVPQVTNVIRIRLLPEPRP